MCWKCIYCMRVGTWLAIAIVGLWVSEWFVCTVVLLVIVDFCEMPPPLSHGLMIMDWLFLRLSNAIFLFNVRSVEAFQHGVLMEVSSCPMHVKRSSKVGLSEGEGIQFDLLLKGVAYHECCCKKKTFSMRVLSLLQDLFISCLKVLVGLRTRDKPLLRTENLFLVLWSERLFTMFLLYWEVYVLMGLIINFRNENLHCFWERVLLLMVVYVCFNRGVGPRVTSLLMWFCIFSCRCIVW